MTSLPSYSEAIAPTDWLALVAPYVARSAYRALCLVSRRFWLAFAPRLWRDILTAVRHSGLDPSDDLDWWLNFVFNKLASVRPQTRALVRVLDARGFAKDAYHFTSDDNERTLQQSFKHALALFPNVTSVLLDDHADLDPTLLIVPTRNSATATKTRPLMLSISGCPFQLPSTFFTSPLLQSLVYLDISDVPGSILPLIQPALLPELRILKTRNREIDNHTLLALVSLFRLRLWSLDISGNKVSDDALQVLREKCFPAAQLRSEAYFRAEGKLANEDRGTPQHGPFMVLEESDWSGSFSHPERYFVDAPMYMARPDQGPQESQAFRSSGRGLSRRDTPAVASTVLSEGPMSTIEDYRHAKGITHLHLSNNLISAVGIEKIVRISNGQLEELSCDDMPLLPHSTRYSKFWPKGASLRGILGAAHIFRPVLSSNLRILRVHHSLVTNIPTLELEGLSTMARLHIVENLVLPRVMMAYPQTFVPDMNPRLSSLTLTHIPRRSSGPLISKIISFLKLLSYQERSVQVVREESSSWRAPGVIQGLRHLRLEFDPDPLQNGFSALEDLDLGGMMNSDERSFSFFEDERAETGVHRLETEKNTATVKDKVNSSADDGNGSRHTLQSVRDDEVFLNITEQWNGSTFSIPIWIGKLPAPCPVLSDYRKLVLEHGCRDGVGPVTPAQILAGVPEKSYVFHTAWCLALMPQGQADKFITPPPMASLAGMKDVLGDLREYRLSGKAKYEKMKHQSAPKAVPLGEPHLFWTGSLEVSRENPEARLRPSQYWR